MEKTNKFYQRKWFAILLLIFFAPIGIFLIFKYEHFKKKTNIVLSAVFGLFFLTMYFGEADTETVSREEVKTKIEAVTTSTEAEEEKDKKAEDNAAKEKQKAEEEAKKKVEEEAKKKEQEKKAQLEFKGNMELKAEEGKIHVNITSNVPDGGIFEVVLMEANFNIVSDFLEIKDGKIQHTFDVSEWEPGEVGGMAMFRFNLDDHPQPDSIKVIYGQFGEKMTGTLAVAHHQNGKNGSIENVTIAYPNETAVKEKRSEQFVKAIQEIIEVSGGIIVDISPRYNDGDWTLVNVVVSDAWYYSAQHEKERFAEQVGNTVETLIVNAGVSKTTSVYFVDTFAKTVAEPKIFGGYKIK
ncbi:hypothetical protein [Bacillus sp. FJAT-45066]|uniref:hypothetical protein n=1 Tax=Bacillus sp. FJAT-45066 TaxID=2011010 RepID=UPI000BB86C9B|nr:hypothetical protein [Bacillus sp. FJAT-45066]